MGLQRGRCGYATALAAGFALLTVSSSALAYDYAAVDPVTGVPDTGDGYLPKVGPLGIPVKATISPSCSFDPSNLPSGTVHAGELNGAFSQQISFGLQCTTPLNIGVVSLNGGLLSPATAATGYTNLRDYHVTLHIQGTTSAVNGDCTASNLTVAATGTCTIRGTATHTAGVGGLNLPDTAMNGTGYVSGSYLQVYSSAYGGSNVLMASTGYADTLTVTLSAVY